MPFIDLSFLHTSPFYEMTALLVLTVLVSFFGQILRQPMIVSFIAAGVLAGPAMLGIVQSHENIDVLAELGIAILLFLVGLKLDLQLIRSLGPVSLAIGLGQVVITSALGLGIGLMMGMDMVTAAYVAIALTFSSTIIIIKLLSDRHEAEALHGRLSIGLLIVQDLVVILAMVVVSSLSTGGDISALGHGMLGHVLMVVFNAILMLLFLLLFMRFIATPLVGRVAHSPEMMIVFAMSWAALLAVCSHYLGFSKELGGLLAGVALASTPYREALVGRLSSIRDFLLLFFFIKLGAQLDLGMLGAQIVPAILLSAFVLLGKPLLVTAIVGALGYRKRTSFLAGTMMGQISEFSLVFIAMGVAIGHIDAQVMALVTLIALITIALSVYMITYGANFYQFAEPMLGIFERKRPFREDASTQALSKQQKYDVILFGLGRYGMAIARQLQGQNRSVLAVDFNPEVVRQAHRLGLRAVYGDACDEDFVRALPLKTVDWVISAMPQRERGIVDEDPRLMLMNSLKQAGYTKKIVLSTHFADDVEILKRGGADVVFLPFQEAAENLVRHICAPEK